MGQRALLRQFGGAIFLAFALAVIFSVTAFGETTGKTTGARGRAELPSNITVSERQIQLFKYALAIRPEQERYWVPVEAALRELGQKPATATVQRASLRTAKADNPNAKFKRLSAAAIPLIKTFDENQRRNLEMLSKTFGFEHWLAAR